MVQRREKDRLAHKLTHWGNESQKQLAWKVIGSSHRSDQTPVQTASTNTGIFWNVGSGSSGGRPHYTNRLNRAYLVKMCHIQVGHQILPTVDRDSLCR